ncbi:CCT domain-containing protein [Chloropicon primus]|uniref:CCT domain-containing protein n=1 Tax=Chloropicon primus TaxID=1764295 RepID=A0A5B8MUU7_9CHLO|nr:hypothetical protein A3770_12p65840 [Chloropicon primus]UPR03274.1 CCT domain-containing protein [Chloropicon primus]|mmetsp:Transcript_5457/g.16547  ORF Transcript_5457/g.16547 Transcript_5457/m.16547 type:complete len:231 (-) Transcript_5457:169-861(-)|eukprot:QDZ24066.1 hypothetical protein A3770_12p65840 [Chloropicon primus]
MVNVPGIVPSFDDLLSAPAVPQTLDAFDATLNKKKFQGALRSDKSNTDLKLKKNKLVDVVVDSSTAAYLSSPADEEAIVPEFKAPEPKQVAQPPQVPAVPTDLDFLDNMDWTSPFELDLSFDSVFDAWDDNNLAFSPPAEPQVAPAAFERSPQTSSGAETTASSDEEVDAFTRNRRACLERYREKKRNRRFSKKVRYHLRKMNADRRPRYKGRFIKKGEVIPQELLDKQK